MFRQKKTSIKGKSRIETSAFNEKKMWFPFTLSIKQTFLWLSLKSRQTIQNLKPGFIVLTLHMFNR